MGRLDGKVAIVTGGASGIGAATARRFVAGGARVVIADLNEEAGEGVARALGPAAAYRHADVGSLADLEAAVAFARERFGGLDVMHNNAAMSGGGYVSEIEPEVWEPSLRVMLTGVFYGMRAAIPALLARGGGSIISTSSVEGFFGEMLAAPYCTAKAGIINLTRTVALEYGRKNIRANCICPGAVDTPMLGLLAQVSPRSREDLAAQHALGRILRPEEIANVALFLASDESSAITGAAIVADGGLTCGLGITGVRPGQFFGLASLFDRPGRRQFSAVAHVPAAVAMMSQEVMNGVAAGLPAGRALQLMAYSWRALSWLLYEKCLLLTMPLRDRLVHELEVLAHDFGRPDPAGVLIDLPLTQADLAELVVGSRAKVSRCVADLRRAGKLEVSGRRLILTRRFARHQSL